jgi:hypothetical protein
MMVIHEMAEMMREKPMRQVEIKTATMTLKLTAKLGNRALMRAAMQAMEVTGANPLGMTMVIRTLTDDPKA